MAIFIKKPYLHFENLNMYLMSYRILINFINTQWLDIILQVEK